MGRFVGGEDCSLEALPRTYVGGGVEANIEGCRGIRSRKGANLLLNCGLVTGSTGPGKSSGCVYRNIKIVNEAWTSRVSLT